MSMRCFIKATLFGFLAVGALASPASAASSVLNVFFPLSCFDFERIGDGTWTPKHTVRVTTWVLTRGLTFRPGDTFNGVDLGAALERNCTGWNPLPFGVVVKARM
jgi:hypothetical protein